jgi:DNA-directed RNA polymerase subunit RPC12/RpoP
MYPLHPHPHHPPAHSDYAKPPVDLRRRYPQYEHHHHNHQEVPASVVTRVTTSPPRRTTSPPRRTTTPPDDADDEDGEAEGEPPVYVLPNDFDMQRDRVEPHIVTYHSPKDENDDKSPNTDERNSDVAKDETSPPRTMPSEDERDSPVSSDASSKSETDENTPVPNTTNEQQQLACKICKKYFPTKSTLYKHLRGHSSDEKPYKCLECGQGFTLSSNLRQHRIIHRGYKPFQCEYCGKKFMRSNVYKQHRRIHTGEQMHKCDHCPSEFLQRYALIKHKKKAHNVETFDK